MLKSKWMLLALAAMTLSLSACGFYMAAGKRSPGWVDAAPAPTGGTTK